VHGDQKPLNLTTLSEWTQFGRVFPLAKNRKPMRGWHWKAKSTDDLLVIASWLDKYADHPWGLVPDRAFVLDVDVKNGAQGPESIEAAGGLEEATLTIRTPFGGFHYYYASDPALEYATKNHWLPGVDIRYGDDGYVVVPYSRAANGRYEVVVEVDGGSLPQVPEWIRKRLEDDRDKWGSKSNGSLAVTIDRARSG
jgi:hypothetical protein